jgi:hypothetical protein
MIAYFLISKNAPPLEGEILLFACDNIDPERFWFSENLFDLGKPGFLKIGNVYVASEYGWPNPQAKFLIEKLREAVDEVVRGLVALSPGD